MKKRTKIRLFVLLFIVLPVIWVAWQFMPPPPPPSLPNDYIADKAAWLGVTWSMTPHTLTEVEVLVKDLDQHGITHIFVYVSYIKPGGYFNPTFDYAAQFTEQFRSIAPHITMLAWIGIPLQLTLPDGSHVNNRLVDPTVRILIAEFSMQLVEDMGFDGVHLNPEMIPDDDSAFINLLAITRDMLPPGALLSVSAHELRVPAGATRILRTTGFWSSDYMRRVAQHVDQIAIMTYDSTLFFPTEYRVWMTYQVRNIASSLHNIDTHVLIGIPASEQETLSHHVIVETASNAIYGLRVGLAESPNYKTIDGIAIYPYWETDPGEWLLIDAFP